KDPAPREPEAEWRDRESVSSAMPTRGVLTNRVRLLKRQIRGELPKSAWTGKHSRDLSTRPRSFAKRTPLGLGRDDSSSDCRANQPSLKFALYHSPHCYFSSQLRGRTILIAPLPMFKRPKRPVLASVAFAGIGLVLLAAKKVFDFAAP